MWVKKEETKMTIFWFILLMEQKKKRSWFIHNLKTLQFTIVLFQGHIKKHITKSFLLLHIQHLTLFLSGYSGAAIPCLLLHCFHLVMVMQLYHATCTNAFCSSQVLTLPRGQWSVLCVLFLSQNSIIHFIIFQCLMLSNPLVVVHLLIF